MDEDNVVAARRRCWRQGAQSATGRTTVEALIVVEGLHDDGQDTETALADLASLLASDQPQARLDPYLLTPASPHAGGGVEDASR